MTLIPQLLAQRDIIHTIVIVDNDSGSEIVKEITSWLATISSDTTVGSEEHVTSSIENRSNEICLHNRIYFVDNRFNGGYSAGNNVGIKLAEKLSADAVLIVNPDVRISDTNYIASLASVLFSDEQICVAASRVLGLDGKDQNPLREPRFWEELLWPRFIFTKYFKNTGYVINTTGPGPITVPKVSGCCLLLTMSFLELNDYLDEGVFLYCEEPILTACVRKVNGLIVFTPGLSVVHAHITSQKSDPSLRMLAFIKSRKYYLKYFSSYNAIQLYSLNLSYKALKFYHATKLRIK